MKVVICWGGVSGYMAACWRELAARPGVDLLVFNFSSQNNSAFDADVMAGINHHALPPDAPDAAAAIKQLIRNHQAEVVSLSGWLYPSYRQLAADPELRDIPMVMVMDTPLLRNWRQRVGRLKLRGHINRMSRVIVPGERAWQYARFLGVPERQIVRAMYGIDYARLAPLYEQRVSVAAGGWPRRFLFVGRYVEEKGIDVLMEGYRRYRAAAANDPWPLTCCGMGPLKERVGKQPGVEDAAFLQPAQVRDMMARHGALVLPSRFDPWPLVVVEAAAAGLPVVCTEACGSAVENVRTDYSGLIVATGDADALAKGLVWADKNAARLPEMGRRGQALASAYSAQAWADRWQRLLAEVAA
jgi:glycosyltransferase involved in cell wall biosynthesis